VSARRRQRGNGPPGRGSFVSEAVCKPSSVPPRAEACVGDGHPSAAAGHPTALAAYPRAGQRTSPPNRSPGTGCALLFGLAPGGVCRVSLRRPTRKPVGGIVTVALVLVSRRTGVTRHPALGSSDFPHETCRIAPTVPRDHPTASLTVDSTPKTDPNLRREHRRAPRRSETAGIARPAGQLGRRTTDAGPPAAARSMA
jgi:hypothetical protein